MIAETQVGIQNLAISSRPIIRATRSGSTVIAEGHARYQEAVLQGNVFSFSTGVSFVTATGTGQIVGGAGDAATLNFAIWNPVGSGKNLVLWKFTCHSSGTGVLGPIWHGMMYTNNVIAVASSNGAVCMNGSYNKSAANTLYSAGGTALTKSGAPWILYMSNFCLTNTTLSSTTAVIPSIEWIEGKIIIPQGYGWLPLQAGQSNLVSHYSIIWEEIPA